MHESSISRDLPKPQFYAELARELRSLTAGEPDVIANLANASALLFHSLPDLNWAGFYLLKDGELVVGPFQGKPACVRIAMGKGVCGTAAARRATVLVPNVHEFPGHIACDSASNSEIVVPMIAGDELAGGLDIDSPQVGGFDAEDQAGLEEFVAVLMAAVIRSGSACGAGFSRPPEPSG
ncbi:MAG TPA: GAF domain-containing protein [Povalibacter sp.]|uniref:GAF domain-containing protein n=1 Tax=Povalibacter sp. TaxID=1962978 RepID=UPI002C329127|nr:GAF domain-containing protein [Povalibacter sp.]HMN45680.1 GAF domain-containing protein [Povalibacter sp.]